MALRVLFYFVLLTTLAASEMLFGRRAV